MSKPDMLITVTCYGERRRKLQHQISVLRRIKNVTPDVTAMIKQMESDVCRIDALTDAIVHEYDK
jgi:hypothetical protein